MELWVVWIKIALIALAGIVLFMLWLRRKRRQQLPALNYLTFAGSLLLLFSATYFAFMQGGERNSELVPSPDGRYVARIMITSGTLADPGPSSVIVRRPRSVSWQRAYIGGGYFQEFGPAMPYIHWVDAKHLVIDYQVMKDAQPRCLSKIDDVVIGCDAHDW